jgi:hypothetical protein
VRDDCNHGPFERPTGQIEQRRQGLHVVSPTVQLRRWLSSGSIAARVRCVTHSWLSVGIQVMVGVCGAHEPVLHHGCTFGRWGPRHGALERPGAESVHDHGSANGTPVNLALLGMHAPVYSRVRFVRFYARLRRILPSVDRRGLNRRFAEANDFTQLPVAGRLACVQAWPPSAVRRVTC